MKKKNKIKLLVTILVVGVFVWFLIIWPTIVFHNNEEKLKKAALRYFELYSNELPVGERVKTVSLKQLYHKSFITDDLLIPYTKNTCSVDNSWVKVKRVNDEYKYYVYLECGLLKSMVDHTGPVIKLNGNNEMKVSLGEKFTDPGINSVVDGRDGKLDKNDIVIKGEVNPTIVGTYKLTYTAFDKLSNKTTVTRVVNVVQDLYSTVKKNLNGQGNYTGNPTNNYVMFSNVLFRIYGIDEDKNIKIVSDEDISNVNYSSLDKWLDYYYNHLNDNSKKMIVESKYCNMKLTDSTLDSTQCSSYTNKRKVYIPSVIDVNKANSGEENFMKPKTISWLSNKKNSKKAYVTRDVFFGEEYGKNYLSYSVDENYGVRPMITIKKDTNIIDGDGTRENPYVFGEVKKAKIGSAINERYSGEYVLVGGTLFRIIEALNDGTTKVVSNAVITNSSVPVTYSLDTSQDRYIYDVKDKNNLGYFINNKMSESVDTSSFVNHIVQVPIYKDKIMYGKEIEKKEYKAKLSAPNMYEMFSAEAQNEENVSYWYLNSSKNGKRVAAVYDIGVPINEKIEAGMDLGIRVVGYLKKNITIVSGKGTYDSPYKIK